MLQNNLDELLKNPKSIYLKHIDPQLPRHGKNDILLTTRHLLRKITTEITEPGNHIIHQYFRGGGAGGNTYHLLAFRPGRIDLAGFVNQVSRRAHAFGQLLDRILAVLNQVFAQVLLSMELSV